MSGSQREGKKKGFRRSIAAALTTNATQPADCVMDEILGKRVDNNRLLYLVRWKGSDKWTWESSHQICSFDPGAQEKIAEYEAKNRSQEELNKQTNKKAKKSDDDQKGQGNCLASLPGGAPPVAPVAKASGKNTGQMLARLDREDSSESGSGSGSSSSRRSSRSRSSSTNSSSSGSRKRGKSSPSPRFGQKEAPFDNNPPVPWDFHLDEDYPTGLDQDFQLEKICKAHRFDFGTFVAVKWKSQPQYDLVTVSDMVSLYSGEMLSFFSELPRV